MWFGKTMIMTEKAWEERTQSQINSCSITLMEVWLRVSREQRHCAVKQRSSGSPGAQTPPHVVVAQSFDASVISCSSGRVSRWNQRRASRKRKTVTKLRVGKGGAGDIAFLHFCWCKPIWMSVDFEFADYIKNTSVVGQTQRLPSVQFWEKRCLPEDSRFSF